MKNNSITCYADLEREELRVKKRIKKHEAELNIRLKKLPEEIVTMGVTKVITGMISGNLLKTGMNVFKGVVASFFKKREENGGGIFKTIFSQVVEHFTGKEKNS